jgi:hypothetical protein
MLLALGLLSLPVFAQEANETNETDDGPLQAGPKGKVNVSAYENVTNFTALFEANCGPQEAAEAGALPGDFTYGFKRFFENVDKFFTFDKGEKAKKHAKYGKLRAVEAHLMTCKAKALADKGDEDAAEDAAGEAENLAEESNEETTEAQENLEEAIEDGSANETEVEEVQNYTKTSIVVLQRVYEKAPEAAKDGLLRALNNSIANYERHQEKMESKDDDDDENETSSSGKGKGPKSDDEMNVSVNASVNTSTSVGKGKSGDDDSDEDESDSKGKSGKSGKSGDDDESEEEDDDDEAEVEVETEVEDDEVEINTSVSIG